MAIKRAENFTAIILSTVAKFVDHLPCTKHCCKYSRLMSAFIFTVTSILSPTLQKVNKGKDKKGGIRTGKNKHKQDLNEHLSLPI